MENMLTKEDCNNLVIFLNRVEVKGIKEVQALMLIINKLTAIVNEIDKENE